jgi:hypothetical protein
MVSTTLYEKLKFTLPNTSIKNIPLTSENKNLSIGFIEIGCKHSNKRSQLTNKKELLYKFWGDNYRNKGIDWYPEIYRILIQYNRKFEPISFTKKYLINHTITCKYVTNLMMDYLERKDKNKIYRTVKKSKKLKTKLEILIQNNEKELIHDMIINSRDKPKLAMIRGTFAELFMLNEIYENIPKNMQLFKNGQINYFNKRYTNGTEIDGIILFYGNEPYYKLINTLKKQPHLEVKKDRLILYEKN